MPEFTIQTISKIRAKKSGLSSGDFYIDSKSGYMVFTEAHHLKRGYCCKNNCRHCAYKNKI